MMIDKVSKTILIITITAILSGCYLVSFEDVSSKENYSQYIGQSYKSNTTTLIYRVSFDQNYKPEPSHYVITSRPGFSGPEVISRAELPIGTIFKVEKVLKCTNCYLDFDDRVKLMVKLTSTDSYNDRDVEINLKAIGNTFMPHKQAANKAPQPTPKSGAA